MTAVPKSRKASSLERKRIHALLEFERALWSKGLTAVAGVDEAGIGPLAGDVVAAAVILPKDIDIPGVDDSKRVGEERRGQLDHLIRQQAMAVSVATLSVAEIDERNIYHAGLEAMRVAIMSLSVKPQHVLVDGRTVPGLGELPQQALIKGDARVYSIACASIVAKVARDRLMREADARYPGYGFAQHKGYGTAAHVSAIRALGLTPIHRRSFPVLRQILGESGEDFYRIQQAVQSAESLGALTRIAQQVASCTLQAADVRKLRLVIARRRARFERDAG